MVSADGGTSQPVGRDDRRCRGGDLELRTSEREARCKWARLRWLNIASMASWMIGMRRLNGTHRRLLLLLLLLLLRSRERERE